MVLGLDDLLYFAFMEEQEKQQLKFTVNEKNSTAESRPPQKENENKKIFFPEVYPAPQNFKREQSRIYSENFTDKSK